VSRYERLRGGGRAAYGLIIRRAGSGTNCSNPFLSAKGPSFVDANASMNEGLWGLITWSFSENHMDATAPQPCDQNPLALSNIPPRVGFHLPTLRAPLFLRMSRITRHPGRSRRCTQGRYPEAYFHEVSEGFAVLQCKLIPGLRERRIQSLATPVSDTRAFPRPSS
jgi:hypothetical protein